MSKPQSFPELQNCEYAVVCAEFDTGIILSLTGKMATGSHERYRIFSTLELAKNFAQEIVAANPGWESAVLNHEGTVIWTCRGKASDYKKPAKNLWAVWWKKWFRI